MAVAPLEQAPIGRALAACATALEEVRDAQPVYLRTEEKESALLAIDQVAAQVDELRLRLIAAADDVADAHAARDTAAWLSHATRCDSGRARREQELAKALDARWSRVAAGMAEGVVSLAQSQVIVEALEALPADLDRWIVGKAEAELVAYAKDFDPRQLRVLGRKILDVVAPDLAEAEEAKRLEAEEQRARERTSLKHRVNGDGTTRFWGVLPDADFARLRTDLDAFTSPRKPRGAHAGEEDKIPYHRRLGQALVALLEHLNPARLPAHGGTATMVMVTIPLAGLRKDVAAAGLLDGDLALGDNLSAAQARRLACTGQVIPVVLGGESEVLDQGRARRLFTPAQVKALRLRDRRCRAEGCTIPAAWCEAHHRDPWSGGGRTDLGAGVLLCSWHHHRVHDRRYHAETLRNGDVRFHRRT